LRTRSQDIGQWIVNLVGMTKRGNVAFSFMAYRSPREVKLAKGLAFFVARGQPPCGPTATCPSGRP
jgi:hypothetical protein